MDLAHGDAVGHDGLTAFRVCQNVSGIEESCVAKPADGAAVLIGEEHPLAEEGLVEAYLCDSLGIGPHEIGIFERQVVTEPK